MAKSGGSVFKRVALGVSFLATQMALFFFSAGRADLPRAWLFFGLSAGLPIAAYFTVLRSIPHARELIGARGRIGRGTRGWDKAIMIVYVLLWLAFPVVAGLDAGRYIWSHQAPWTATAGSALFIAGYAVVLWAMSVNRFFECTVRIQEERGHEVVSSGPYRFVRHPGYSGMILIFLSSPLVIGSSAAYALAVPLMVLIALRTTLEDRMLRRELSGYGSYAQRVRYRLLPGVW